MTPSHACKGAARYRYYVSLALTKGRKEEAGSVTRAPAYDVEQRVTEALRNHVAAQIRAAQLATDDQQLARWPAWACAGDRELVAGLIERVTVETDRIVLRLKQEGPSTDQDPQQPSSSSDASVPQLERSAPFISISWTRPASRRRREVILPEGAQRSRVRPMRDEVRANLLRAIARARRSRDELLQGHVTSVEQIAGREGVSSRSVRMTLSLAFLSPAIVRATIDGKLPRGIGLSKLSELPASWAEQHMLLGLQSF